MVIKRDGRKVPFDKERIVEAIMKAMQSCGEVLDSDRVLADSIANLIESKYVSDDVSPDVSVEDIQDIIERKLMQSSRKDVAKAYINCREQRNRVRGLTALVTDRIDYMNEYIHSGANAATSSETDANANVSIKNVANLDGEVYKTQNREIQRYRLTQKLKELYPEVADQYVKDIEHHIIYPHDEASAPTVKNYCEAVTLYPMLLEGTSSMDGVKTSAPKHLHSFAGQIANLDFLLAAQCKGAVAFGEFFNFLDYFCAKDFGYNYHERAYREQASIFPPMTIAESIHQSFQEIVCMWNQPAGNRSYQSPFTNISYYDEGYWHALFDDFCFPDGTKPVWERVSWLQKDFMRWFNDYRKETILTFPVETMAMLTDGNDIIDKEYKDFAAEMYADGHSFFTYLSDNPNALASCCRLRNQIQENVFSFTNGLTGVQTGSVNVYTLNISRIAQDFCKKDNWTKADLLSNDKRQLFYERFKEYLCEILERVYKYHIAYKTLVYEVEEAGMLTASNAGYISMQKLYSTIGINGHNEAAEFLGMKCNYNEEYKEFINFLTGTISEQNRLHSAKRFMFNTELVPAEGLSSKNYNWDREDGYWVPEDRCLYNSYIYRADDTEISVLDKFRLHGREFTSLLDGGVGLHCNLDEHLSKSQYLKLFDVAVHEGTSYFTFNGPLYQCDKCGHIGRERVNECPECHSKRLTWWTRVVGFLRPQKSFDHYRWLESLTRALAKKDSV